MADKTVRYGEVSAVDPEAHAVRVIFADEDEMVSDWLPVVVTCASKNQDYALPDVNDRVVCLFLGNGVSAGFCIGAVYSQANRPVQKNPNVRSVTFSDGAIVSYDREKHTLTVETTGAVNIKAGGNVNVIGDVIANGISLEQHTHPESIGSVTGPPTRG